jgi:hypothetical protein
MKIKQISITLALSLASFVGYGAMVGVARADVESRCERHEGTVTIQTTSRGDDWRITCSDWSHGEWRSYTSCDADVRLSGSGLWLHTTDVVVAWAWNETPDIVHVHDSVSEEMIADVYPVQRITFPNSDNALHCE